MQDNLEKFIKDRKGDFDLLTPKDSLWEGLQIKLEASKNAAARIIFWRAAAIILFVFSIGLTFYANRDYLEKNTKVVYGSEFITTEKYYTAVIKQRQELILKVASTYPDIAGDFEMDWKMLDQSYAQLKQEYSENQSNEVLVALVQNLQSRVNLLNRQIEVLELIESDEEKFLNI